MSVDREEPPLLLSRLTWLRFIHGCGHPLLSFFETRTEILQRIAPKNHDAFSLPSTRSIPDPRGRGRHLASLPEMLRLLLELPERRAARTRVDVPSFRNGKATLNQW